MEFYIKSEKELKDIAQKLKQIIADGNSKTATVIALKGDLGAGKTTFTKEVAGMVGVIKTVSSPTFVIERVYDIDFAGFKRFVHIDAYRIDNEKELKDLGFETLTSNNENLIIIEWPEKVEKIIPKDAIKIEFQYGKEASERKIIIHNKNDK